MAYVLTQSMRCGYRGVNKRKYRRIICQTYGLSSLRSLMYQHCPRCVDCLDEIACKYEGSPTVLDEAFVNYNEKENLCLIA